MDVQKIKELALANGFKLKEQADGSMDLNAYVYDFANAIEQAAKAQVVHECTWMGAYDCSVFESSCGHTFELSNDGTLDDNNMKHCCFCGGKLIEAQEPAND